MEARLFAIQRGLLLLLAASIAVAILTRPAPENRRYVLALDEVARFRQGFNQQNAEQSLRDLAAAQGVASLRDLGGASADKPGPKLKASAKIAPVPALASVSLATLEEVVAHADEGSKVSIALLDVEALAASLTWRLARAQRTGISTVTAVELLPAEVTKEDVALEKQAGELRIASLDARAALEEAESRIGILEYRVKAQSERRSRSLYKSRLALDEAKVTLQQRTDARTDTQTLYDKTAQRAERKRKLATPGPLTKVPEAAVARVTYEYDGKLSTLDVPVPLVQRQVNVPPLTVMPFTAVRAAGLWDDVKAQPPEEAMATIREHFNWHLQGVKVFGMELNGTSILQILPCILPFLLAVILRRIRQAEVSYSPFATEMPRKLPSVGFRNRFLEFLTIIVLPLVAVASAAAALMLNDRLPILPALTGAACVALGVYAFTKVRELRDQTLSIVRHSFPPPAAK